MNLFPNILNNRVGLFYYPKSKVQSPSLNTVLNLELDWGRQYSSLLKDCIVEMLLKDSSISKFEVLVPQKIYSE